ncbi:MAG: hypothetical protein ABIT20_24075 [Gemmatimonadaceae bacterium]
MYGRIPAERPAAYGEAPFVGAAASLLVFRERPAPLLLAGAALMGIGAWLHLTERYAHEPGDPPVDPVPHSHAHRHERLAHAHPHYPDRHHRHAHE